MISERVGWCLKQLKGIRLINSSELISESYLKEAESDFNMAEKANKKWRTIAAYYACYNSVYAILMKIGIKCEIHECTISLMELLGFNKKEIEFLENLKKERVDVQYYLKPSSISVRNSEILEFMNKSKLIARNINDSKINEIRAKLRNIKTFK